MIWLLHGRVSPCVVLLQGKMEREARLYPGGQDIDMTGIKEGGSSFNSAYYCTIRTLRVASLNDVRKI